MKSDAHVLGVIDVGMGTACKIIIQMTYAFDVVLEF